jgi:hypothetical protein
MFLVDSRTLSASSTEEKPEITNTTMGTFAKHDTPVSAYTNAAKKDLSRTYYLSMMV